MRKPNISSAATDFGFLAIALVAGLAGAGWPVAALLYLAAVATWWWTRRGALARLDLRARLTQSAIALLMLAVVMGIFYWIGLMLGGHS
jgi:hypothetical protein